MEHLTTRLGLDSGGRLIYRPQPMSDRQKRFCRDLARLAPPGETGGCQFAQFGPLRTLWSLLMLVTVLASCAPLPRTEKPGWRPSPIEIQTADYGAYPSDYETIVKAWYLRSLKDPDSARFGRITRPLREHAIRNQLRKEAIYGYSVCARVNARNSFGGYTGFKTRWFLIRNGRIVRTSPPRFHIYIGRPYRCIDGPKSG